MAWFKNWLMQKTEETKKEEPLQEEVLKEESLAEEPLTLAETKTVGEDEADTEKNTEPAAKAAAEDNEAAAEDTGAAVKPAAEDTGAAVEPAAEEDTGTAAKTAAEEDTGTAAKTAAEDTGTAAEAVPQAPEDTAEDAAEGTAPADEEVLKERAEVPADLSSLEPAAVFTYFRAIAAIPHGSFHTKAISDYLEGFAQEHGLEYVRDETGNLVISRPASPGLEGAAPVALQGHVDMVCEKESSNPINMETEAITLRTDGEWLWADRTTLGGDDGIAVAIMLTLLSDPAIKCPPLECIFTVDEEVGLLGAHALDLSGLKSRRLINIDSEREGFIIAGCAGGAEEVCTLSGRRHEKKGQVLEITIDGLRGGHSGEQISEGRANADLLLARLLYSLEPYGKYCLISFNGGMRDNAIPRDAKAEILFTGKVKRGDVKSAVASFAADIKKEYSVTDPDIHIRAVWTQKGEEELRIAFTRKDSRRMIRFLTALPNGVIEYSPLDRSIPQTSLSLGIVKTMADGMQTHTLIRSSINSQKQMMMDKIECVAEAYGAMVETRGAYPAWELIERSAFRDHAARIYREITGKDAVVVVTHGGLECGILASKVEGLDCISIGPDMEEIHTPSERLNIPSCAHTYAYIRAILEACAEN